MGAIAEITQKAIKSGLNRDILNTQSGSSAASKCQQQNMSLSGDNLARFSTENPKVRARPSRGKLSRH